MSRRGENIRKRKDGRWEGRYLAISEPNNKKYVSIYARTYSEAKEKLLEAKIGVGKGHYAGKKQADENEENKDIYKQFELSPRIDYGFAYKQVAVQWLEQVQSTRKYSTYVKYRGICLKYILPELEKTTVTSERGSNRQINLAMPQTEELSDSMKKSIASISREFGRYATENHGLPPLKMIFEYSRKKREEITVLTNCEQKKLIRFLNTDMDVCKMGIMLCLSTGIRLGELCALMWSDFDADNGCLYINRTVQRISSGDETKKTMLMITPPKSIYSCRKIPLSDRMFSILKAYTPASQEGYILRKEKPMEPRTCQNRFKSYLKQAGIKTKNFHVLRHTFATNCICNGMDVKCLSEILGHSDVKITLNRYVHPSIETKRQHMNSLLDIYGQYLE